MDLLCYHETYLIMFIIIIIVIIIIIIVIIIGCTCGMWKFPGQGLYLHHSSHLSQCSDNTIM